MQTVYGPSETVRLTEFSYNRDFAGGLLNVKLGRLYTQGDFTASPQYWGEQLYCNFLSNGICGRPIGLPLNSGFVSYPVSSWAGRVRLSLPRDISLSIGAYEVNPALRGSGHGFDLGTGRAIGAFLPLELGVKAGREDGLPGNYRIGAYYDTSTVQDAASNVSRYTVPDTEIPDDFTRLRSGRYGFYVLTDQMIQSDSPGSPRGTVALLNLQYGDPRTSLISWFGFAGLVRRGTFAGRDGDTIAAGVSTVSINSRIREAAQVLQETGLPTTRANREIVLETNYGAAFSPWLNLRSGVQYIMRPAGRADIPNALVFDLKTSIRF
ncbi:carbohydrate porin [Roseomonas mucosa]